MDRRENRDRYRSRRISIDSPDDLICPVKYGNNLPDVPFDTKSIGFKLDSARFFEYHYNSLEESTEFEFLTEPDLGIPIDVINYSINTSEEGESAASGGVILDPADEILLEDETVLEEDCKKPRQHTRNVSWLRRTQYISTEHTRFQSQSIDTHEAKVGYSIKKLVKEDTTYMDKANQIKAIQKTFKDSAAPIEKHYSKSNVYAIESLPVFPDFKLWKYSWMQVVFDSLPVPTSCPARNEVEKISQAIIKGVTDESGDEFVAYFLPTEQTLKKRRNDIVNQVEYVANEEYKYEMAREYNWNVKSKESNGCEENCFFVVRDDGVYYNKLETKVQLNKRRQRPDQHAGNTRLVVKHIQWKTQDLKIQRCREQQLEPLLEEEEEND